MFCDGYYSDLTTHIKLKHKNITEVKAALKSSSSDRIQYFADVRRRGILKTNEEQSRRKDRIYERDRNQGNSSQLVMCTGCKKFITKRGIPPHVLTCQNVGFGMKSSLLSDPSNQCSENFRNVILNGVRDDGIGKIVKQDEAILTYGIHQYELKSIRLGKEVEVKKAIRTDMCSISRKNQ